MSQTPSSTIAAAGARLAVPFGGVHGWLADLTFARKGGSGKAGFSKGALVTESYYVAETDQARAMRAIRTHAGAGRDAVVVLRRTLSRKEVAGLGLVPGKVKSA